MKKRVLQQLKEQHQLVLEQFDEVSNVLRPNGGLQERVYNPYYFINQYGYEFIEKIVMHEDINFRHEHYLIYL